MALIVRMVKGQRVRHVPSKSVGKMRQNGWTVAESETPEIIGERGPEEIQLPEQEPPPKRRRKSQPSETNSEGLSLPEHKEGNS